MAALKTAAAVLGLTVALLIGGCTTHVSVRDTDEDNPQASPTDRNYDQDYDQNYD